MRHYSIPPRLTNPIDYPTNKLTPISRSHRPTPAIPNKHLRKLHLAPHTLQIRIAPDHARPASSATLIIPHDQAPGHPSIPIDRRGLRRAHDPSVLPRHESLQRRDARRGQVDQRIRARQRPGEEQPDRHPTGGRRFGDVLSMEVSVWSIRQGEHTYAGPVEVDRAVVVVHVNVHRGREEPLQQALRGVDGGGGGGGSDNREPTTAVLTDPVAQALFADQVGDVGRKAVGRQVVQQRGFEREKHAAAEAHEDVLGVVAGGGFVQNGFDRQRAQPDVTVGDAVAADFGVAGEEVCDCVGTGERIEGALVGVSGRRAEVYGAGGGRENRGARRSRGSHCGQRFGVFEDDETVEYKELRWMEMTQRKVEEQRNLTSQSTQPQTQPTTRNGILAK